MHARAELEQARLQTQQLQQAAEQAQVGHVGQVEVLREQQAALVQRCKEADEQLQEIMYVVCFLQEAYVWCMQVHDTTYNTTTPSYTQGTGAACTGTAHHEHQCRCSQGRCPRNTAS